MAVEPLAIQVMREFHRALLAHEEAQVARMVRAWMTVDKALAADIRALAEEIVRLRAAGEVVTEAQLYRLSRYQSLVAQIQIEITRYEQRAAQIILAGESDMARMGVNHAQGAIRAMYRTFGVRGAFNHLPVRAVEYMVGLTADGGPLFGLLQQRALTPAAVDGLTKTLIEAVTRGWNPRKTARAMQDGLTDGLQKALVIARDQQLRVYRMASDQQYRESGVVSAKRRVAAKDGRTCLACLAMDGELIPVGMEMYDHAAGRCLTPGTAVSGPLPIGFIARYYQGDVVSIRTATGKFLTVTPNHPILTDRGWVTAQFIQEGDNVVCDGGSDGTAPAMCPDDYQVPTLVEDIPRTRGFTVAACVPGAAKDFHGDGMDAEVYVVWADGLLGDGLDAAFAQPLSQHYLRRRDMRDTGLSGGGDATAMRECLFAPTASILGDGDTAMVLLDGGLFGQQAVGLSLVADRGLRMPQAGVDGGARNAIGLSKCVRRFPGQITIDDLVIGQTEGSMLSYAHLGRSDFAALLEGAKQSTSLESIREALLSSVETSCDRLRALASTVSLDRVLEIGVRTFAGHVYNLQTRVGWYSANGIITHNCTAIPILSGLPPLSWQYGPDWFESLPAAKQREMMGPGRYEMWREGAFDFRDLATPTYDPTWGRGLAVTPLSQLASSKLVGSGGTPAA